MTLILGHFHSKNAHKLNPFFEDIYYYRGNSKFKLYDYIGAIDDYSRSIELNPNNKMSYFNRGLSKLGLKQKENGCLDLSKAGELGFEFAYEVIKEKCL